MVAKSNLRGCLLGGRNILEGGTTLRCLTCRNFGLCGAQVEKDQEGINNDRRQKQKCNLGSSTLFTVVITTFQQNNYNHQIVLTPNEIFSLNCRGYPCIKQSSAAVVAFVNDRCHF